MSNRVPRGHQVYFPRGRVGYISSWIRIPWVILLLAGFLRARIADRIMKTIVEYPKGPGETLENYLHTDFPTQPRCDFAPSAVRSRRPSGPPSSHPASILGLKLHQENQSPRTSKLEWASKMLPAPTLQRNPAGSHPDKWQLDLPRLLQCARLLSY